jgi:Tfp pilus assembly protein PilF
MLRWDIFFIRRDRTAHEMRDRMKSRIATRFCCLVLTLVLVGALGCRSSGKTTRVDLKQNTELAIKENDEAFKLIQKGKYDDAQVRLRKALDADAMFGPAHNNLGLVYFHQNKLYEAAWEFQHAAKLMPHQPEPKNNLGLVFEKAGKMDDATEAYSKARLIEPDNPEYLGNLARAKVRSGADDAETRKLLEEVVLKDSREEWTVWARMNLIRLNQLPAQESPSSKPGARREP